MIMDMPVIKKARKTDDVISYAIQCILIYNVLDSLNHNHDPIRRGLNHLVDYVSRRKWSTSKTVCQMLIIGCLS